MQFRMLYPIYPLHLHATSMHILAAAAVVSLLAFHAPACFAADNVVPVDSALIATLQIRAEQAPLRDRVQLFADLADKITLLASRQIADGNDEQAQATLKQLEACTAQLQDTIQLNSKGLKKTEVMLHLTNRRLKDLVRAASGNMKPMVQSALMRLNQTQTTLLSAVFSK